MEEQEKDSAASRLKGDGDHREQIIARTILLWLAGLTAHGHGFVGRENCHKIKDDHGARESLKRQQYEADARDDSDKIHWEATLITSHKGTATGTVGTKWAASDDDLGKLDAWHLQGIPGCIVLSFCLRLGYSLASEEDKVGEQGSLLRAVVWRL